jgi:hypothetical protein
MRLTCLAKLIRSAEGPQKLRGLFAAPRGASEIAALMTDSTQISNKLRPPCSRCGKPLLLSTIIQAKPGSDFASITAHTGGQRPCHCILWRGGGSGLSLISISASCTCTGSLMFSATHAPVRRSSILLATRSQTDANSSEFFSGQDRPSARQVSDMWPLGPVDIQTNNACRTQYR